MLRIAQIGSVWENIPPKTYGGTERVVWSLTEGLVKKGHDVTLFAAGTAKTSAELISIYPRPLIHDNIPWTNLTYPLLNLTECLDREKEFDIIHMHLNKSSDYLFLPLSQRLKNKTLTTVHFPYPASRDRRDRHLVLQKYRNLNYTSISDAARKGGENLNWLGTVYNGVEKSEFEFCEKPEDYYIWIGKFNPDKGTDIAIRAAKKAGVKLVLAGTIDKLEKEDFDYYKTRVEPLIDNRQIIYIGEVGGKKKNEVIGKAIAFLNPIVWNEPFGLVMAESLATGTPVIAFNNGAAPEILEDGRTGYLVESLAEMVVKIKKVLQLKRIDCRNSFERSFTAEKMVNSYEKIYQKMAAKKNND